MNNRDTAMLIVACLLMGGALAIGIALGFW